MGKFFGWLKLLWPRFKKFWFGDWFDPRQSFLKLPAFWGPLIFIGLIAGVACLKVKVDHGLAFDLTGDIDQWYRWFQVPIWIFALLIPVIGLCNANHKSEQTKASMELTQKSTDATGAQNRFANYYKHVEEFSKYVDLSSFSSSVDIKKIDSRRLHRLIFPQASEGVYQVAFPVLIELWDLVESFVEACISSLRDELEEKEIRRSADSHRIFIKFMLNQGNIFKASLTGKITEGKRGGITISKPSVSVCMNTVLNEIEFAHWLFSFDTSFDKELLWNSVHQLLDQIIGNMAINEFGDVISHMSDKITSDTLDTLETSLFEIRKHSVWLESQVEGLRT